MPDFIVDNLSGEQFEASVRHVARQLYRHSNLTGSIKVDGRERDEIIDTGTEHIIVEATQKRGNYVVCAPRQSEVASKPLAWEVRADDRGPN